MAPTDRSQSVQHIGVRHDNSRLEMTTLPSVGHQRKRLNVNPGELDACGEQQRWTEGNGGRDEGGDKGHGESPMQKRASRTETSIRVSAGDGAPHPAQHDHMREESRGKPKTQRAGRPAKGAADTVNCVESNQRTAPDGKTRREPPEMPWWYRTLVHGRDPNIATSAGRARTRPIAMIPVTSV